jgi:predicted acetylornithine/succinylornithine family transaminase/N-acetyl-ornithine/N-acetyl-lysine deacetylase
MIATIDLENTYTSGVYSKRPVVIVRGCGALVWDAEGREYIDCTSGYGVANIGHARPEIAAALASQAQRLITCPEIVYNDVRARLLERLAGLTPGGLTHFFLCNSGTEAVEGALKFARLATGRTGIVAALRGFHGRTMGALSTTWEPHYREPFAPLVPGVNHVRYNDLAAAEAAISEDTAAVIIELVQGEGGVHVASEEYVHGLAALCHDRGALLIIDEVQTGLGRTGSLFACNHYDLQPDILCLAKSLAGGVPMGAVCLGPRVMESGRITRGVHGSTFGGNPLACAAALATLDIIEREALPERAAVLGAYALERLSALHSPLMREVRGRGLLLGIELSRRAQPFLEMLFERGILALPAGPNVIRLLPPLVTTEEQLEQVINTLQEVLLGEPVANPTAARATGSTTSDETTTDAISNEISILRNMLTIPSYSRQESALAHYLLEQAQQLGLHACIDQAGNFIASTHPLAITAAAQSEQAAGDHDAGDHEGRPYSATNGLLRAVHGRGDPRGRPHRGRLSPAAPLDVTGDTDQQSIILLGHMDTVQGNIPVELQDGVLYGRGAVDAKGPLAAFLCATARLARLERTSSLKHPVIVIGAVEEESATSRGARAVVERFQPSACIIGEPSGSQSVTIGYKGRLLVEYCITRPIRHSAVPGQNSSEVAIAFWNRVCQHAAAWNEQHAANSTFSALMPSLRSINSGQDGLEEQTRLFIGYRWPPDYNIADLRALLELWALEDGAQLSFSGEEVAFQTTRTTPLSKAFITAIRTVGGQPSFKLKTGTSDMNVVGPIWGQNVLAYGPGDSRLDHTPREHIHINEYLQAIDVLELVLRELVLQREIVQ